MKDHLTSALEQLNASANWNKRTGGIIPASLTCFEAQDVLFALSELQQRAERAEAEVERLEDRFVAELAELNREAERQTKTIILLKHYGSFVRERYTGFGPNAYDCSCCGAIMNGGNRKHASTCELARVLGEEMEDES